MNTNTQLSICSKRLSNENCVRCFQDFDILISCNHSQPTNTHCSNCGIQSIEIFILNHFRALKSPPIPHTVHANTCIRFVIYFLPNKKKKCFKIYIFAWKLLLLFVQSCIVLNPIVTFNSKTCFYAWNFGCFYYRNKSMHRIHINQNHLIRHELVASNHLPSSDFSRNYHQNFLPPNKTIPNNVWNDIVVVVVHNRKKRRESLWVYYFFHSLRFIYLRYGYKKKKSAAVWVHVLIQLILWVKWLINLGISWWFWHFDQTFYDWIPFNGKINNT